MPERRHKPSDPTTGVGDLAKSSTGIVPLDGQGGAQTLKGSDDLGEGSAIGNYVVDRIIGGGGGGTVYSARHRVLGRRVAVKVLREEMAASPAMVERFVREAAAVNKIRHPNIVDIFEFGELAPGRPFYVMEVLDGMDLRKVLHVCGRFTPAEMLELIEPVCSAVQAAHDAGIVHRDLKASNVLVVEKNGQRSIKLLDFGIAKMLNAESAAQGLTEPGTMVGTAHNMAPEQIRADRVDSRADIYALGVLIFQLLTGRYPFDADDPMQIAMLHLQAPPPRPSALVPLPPGMDAVVLRCLEKLPQRRFASVNELVLALREAVGGRKGLQEQSSRAIAIYFEVLTGESDELDDAIIEDMTVILDTIEQSLSSASFALPLRTSTSLLGVKLMDEDADGAGEELAAGATVAEIEALLAERPCAHPRVEVVVAMSVGQVLCRPSEQGFEIVGGPLLEVGTWTNQRRIAAG
jgi:serine/threonine-protein kinase